MIIADDIVSSISWSNYLSTGWSHSSIYGEYKEVCNKTLRNNVTVETVKSIIEVVKRK